MKVKPGYALGKFSHQDELLHGRIGAARLEREQARKDRPLPTWIWLLSMIGLALLCYGAVIVGSLDW